jgi:uncharacterized membrane protein (UPF0127 family)
MPKEIKLMGIADDEISQAQGLQYIRSLPDLSGMLFKFKHPRVLSFWMIGTSMPLEIAFINHENIIVKTEQMTPFSTRSVTSGRPCVMALEVAAGDFARVGACVGKTVSIDLEQKKVIIDD